MEKLWVVDVENSVFSSAGIGMPPGFYQAKICPFTKLLPIDPFQSTLLL